MPARCPVALVVLSLAFPSLAHAEAPQAASSSSSSSASSSVTTSVVVAPAPAADPWPAAAPVAVAPAPVVVAAPVVPPPRVVGPPPPPVKNTEGNDLIASGLATFGTFYVFTSLAGAVIIDRTRRLSTDAYTGEKDQLDTRRLNYGRALLVPIAGPFLGLHYTSSARERWGLVLTGTAQLTGAVLALVGVSRKLRARRAQRYSVGAGVASGGAMISVGGRF